MIDFIMAAALLGDCVSDVSVQYRKSVEVRGHLRVLFIMYTRPADPQTFRILPSLPPFSQ